MSDLKFEKRRRFSTYHLYSAIHNCRKAGIIEDGVRGKNNDYIFKGEKVGRWQPIHDGHVITCFLEAFAAIECDINEYIVESEKVQKLGENFQRDLTDLSALEKYQVVLMTVGKDIFETGEEPYQSADLLRRIRNYFMHYKTRKIDYVGEEPSHKFAKGLKTKGVSFDNPYSSDDDEYFPTRALNYSVGKWAVQSAIDIIDEFYDRIGKRPAYAGYKERMMNELRIDWERMDPQW